MSQAARVGRILTLLRGARRGVPTGTMLDKLGVSRATYFRDIDVLRDQMGQPIVYDGKQKGWRLEQNPAPGFQRDELPGVWVSAEECYALLTLHNVLRRIDPGFLEDYVLPLRQLLKRILALRDFSSAGFSRKIAVDLGPIKRIKAPLFAKISNALFNDQRLKLSFLTGGKIVVHEVLPQQLVLTPTGWQLSVVDVKNGQPLQVELAAVRAGELVAGRRQRRDGSGELMPV